MLKHNPRRGAKGIWFAPFLLLVVLLWSVEGVRAHGGGALQIANAPVGTCLASVWLAPSDPQANKTLHVTVGLADAASGAPVLDGAARVTVTAVTDGEQVATALATTAQSVNRLFYEADLPPLTTGEYLFTVTTTCQGVTEALTFVAQIRPSTNPLFVALPLAAGGLLVAVWLRRQWRSRETAAGPARRRTGPRPPAA